MARFANERVNRTEFGILDTVVRIGHKNAKVCIRDEEMRNFRVKRASVVIFVLECYGQATQPSRADRYSGDDITWLIENGINEIVVLWVAF